MNRTTHNSTRPSVPRWLVLSMMANNSESSPGKVLLGHHTCFEYPNEPCALCGRYEVDLPETNPYVCDFCSGEGRVKTYRTREVEWEGTSVRLRLIDETLTACTTCAELLDSKRWEELTQRTIDKLREVYPPGR